MGACSNSFDPTYIAWFEVYFLFWNSFAGFFQRSAQNHKVCACPLQMFASPRKSVDQRSLAWNPLGLPQLHIVDINQLSSSLSCLLLHHKWPFKVFLELLHIMTGQKYRVAKRKRIRVNGKNVANLWFCRGCFCLTDLQISTDLGHDKDNDRQIHRDEFELLMKNPEMHFVSPATCVFCLIWLAGVRLSCVFSFFSSQFFQ